MTLLVYSCLLLAVMVVGAPWWLARMAVSGRYRAGLAGRLGRVPKALRAWVGAEQAAGREVVWLHAVSVGEVLAATRLVARLGERGLAVAVSTTTETGQALARARFGAEAVFYLPLDFGVLMRRYLQVLRPRLVVLMESELWPNMIRECTKAGVPVAVANARVSDRSFPRYMMLRRVWGPLLQEVAVFLAQSEETAARLRAMGVTAERVVVAGNLKYDVVAPARNAVAERVRELSGGRAIVVAGSTLEGEEALVVRAWDAGGRGALLVLAPRHPARFAEMAAGLGAFQVVRASGLGACEAEEMAALAPTLRKSAKDGAPGGCGSIDCAQEDGGFPRQGPEIVLLDTIGDLAAVYGVATVAFVGGSLVAKGGHNPLEPAQFGVPVVMGPSYENFREIVEGMLGADGIKIVGDKEELEAVLLQLLIDPKAARALGERGRGVFEAQQGATERVVEALLGLLR